MSHHVRELPVLITGVTGFIGRHLLSQVPAHWQVRALVRDASQLAALRQLTSLHLVAGDLLRPQTLEDACRGQEVIIHLAGLAHVAGTTLQAQREAHVEASRHLLHAAVAAGVKRFVYVSSIKAASPDTPYGVAKRETEEMLLDAHHQGLIEVCCLRPTAVYGQGMKGSLATWIDLVRRGKAPPVPPDSARVAMIGVHDLCAALILAAESPQVAGGVYALSDRHVYRMREIEHAIRKALGKSPNRWYLPRPCFYLAACLGQALQVLGKPVPFGMQAYHTLFEDAYQIPDDFERATGFRASTNFYQQLPALLAH